MSPVRVAVNGYGVIGKRVADAVTFQPDMELVGAADIAAARLPPLWEDTLAVVGHEVYLTYVVHNEAIVVPENVDAIRALAGLEPDGDKSISATDATVGLRATLP